ncbi:MAG: hypothetical protein HZA92_01055 [Verrucomicrobia bacterium]|nr:hypothetical protein [Verrucomicrobiota bacterium]
MNFIFRPSAAPATLSGVDLAEYKMRRPRHEQASLLVLAFVCSIVAHVVFMLAWEFRAHLPHLAWMDWLKAQSAKLNPVALLMKIEEPKPLPPELKKLLATQPPPEDPPMPQLTFVDVDPALATEPPKDAKFYSPVSTRAANPDPKIQSNVPKMDGKQEQFAKVTEVARPLPLVEPPPAPKPKAPTPPPETRTTTEPKPQPSPSAPQAAQPKKAEPQPLKPVPPPAPKPAGDTLPQPKLRPPAPTQTAKATADFLSGPSLNPSTAKPIAQPEPGEADTKISRPRTIKEALARRQQSGLVGERMKQEGGVKHLGVSALDVRGMAFGAYDAAIIQAIQQRWHDLLESRPTPRGKVVLEFRLHFDGRVTDMKVNDADVGDLYALFCQKAVQDPAPYPRWPSDMRRQLAADHRDVRFTFYYN